MILQENEIYKALRIQEDIEREDTYTKDIAVLYDQYDHCENATYFSLGEKSYEVRLYKNMARGNLYTFPKITDTFFHNYLFVFENMSFNEARNYYMDARYWQARYRKGVTFYGKNNKEFKNYGDFKEYENVMNSIQHFKWKGYDIIAKYWKKFWLLSNDISSEDLREFRALKNAELQKIGMNYIVEEGW